MNGKKYAYIGLGCMVILASVAFFIGRSTSGKPSNQATADNSAYPLLAKRIFVDNPSDTRVNFSPLRKELNQYFTDNKLTGGLYFEYLPTGTSIRVNGSEEFRAASLIKLPVAMELYKAAELGKADLDKKVALKQEWLNDGYGDLYRKGAGYELSLREAAQILLTDSDNTALRMILDTTETALNTEDRALGSLDVEFTAANDGSISIGARSYASFLKCLYFACYNNKQDSQTILEMLTKSDFNNRLVAGIADKNIKVAHKIGVFNTQVQSDCGIVYVPEKNYILCIMLQGDDNDVTNQHIAKLSELTYQYVTK